MDDGKGVTDPKANAWELFRGAGSLILGGLQELGFDTNTENFNGTPNRMASACMEIFDGCGEMDIFFEKRKILSKAFPAGRYNDMIVEAGITAFSFCPHHLLPVEYKISVGYIPDMFSHGHPDSKVLGLSKLARLVQVIAKQPLLQEEFTQEIVQSLQELNPQGVAVLVAGRHMCMRMRGVKAEQTTAITSAVSGVFREKPETRAEFMSLVAQDTKF